MVDTKTIELNVIVVKMDVHQNITQQEPPKKTNLQTGYFSTASEPSSASATHKTLSSICPPIHIKSQLTNKTRTTNSPMQPPSKPP